MQTLTRSAPVSLLSAALLALASLSGCDRSGAAKLAVTEAWVRLPAVKDRPAAGYFTLKGGASDDRLTAIESAVVKRIELHEGGMKGSMITMRPITGVDLRANGTVAFAPGGNHTMLFGIDPAITPGTAIPMRFRFASGAAIEVEAK